MRNLSLTALLLAALTLGACSGSSADKETTVHNVFTTLPEPVGSGATHTYPATVEEARTISVGFKTAGQIERIMVKEGSRVSAGQTIALLDTVDYALGINAMREQYSQMRKENERRRKLHAAGNMSDNDLENALSGERQLALQLQMNENKLDYCRLTAPTSGVVTKVNFENSEMVDAGTPVIELMDNSHLEVVVDLPVRHYADREDFSDFTGITSDGRRMPLRLLSLTPRADNNQLFRLRLGLTGGAEGLTPGMNVTVEIGSKGSGPSTVNIPVSALFEREGSMAVWVVNPADSVVSARSVVTSGTGEDGFVEVTSGLSATDVIVRAGAHHLSEGEKVNIIKPSDNL